MVETRTAIVTGASSGIGRAACLLLAREGFNLALVARRRDQLDATAAEAKRLNGLTRCLVLPIDLRDEQAVGALVVKAEAEFGRVHALVNVAGSAPLLPIERVTPEIGDCLDANLSYVVAMTAAAWPMFRRQGGGMIVNVSSMASIDPFEGFAIYAAAKAGLNMFTLATGREGQSIGVRAVAIAPGCVETPMLRQNFGTDVVPPNQALAPESVAKVIVDCVVGRRAFKPGETILVPSP